MQPPRILIIGAGQAGGRAAAALRQRCYECRITLVGDEQYRPYERPPLSKSVLVGSEPDDTIFLQGAADYQTLDLNWQPGVRIHALDTAAQQAITEAGDTLAFDRCLLATGGRVRTLPNVPPETPNVHYLRDLDDARSLRRQMQANRRVAVLGGGFLGLEFASSALRCNMDVTVFEAAPHLLARVAPAIFGCWLQSRHVEAGVRVVTDAQVAAVEPTADGVTLRLATGETESFDLLLISIGQQPNVELAQASGLEVDDGIRVDARCETSAPGVFAAGDCAAQFNTFAGQTVRFESWQNAQEQAAVAAAAMLDQSADSQVIPWFWSDQLHRNIQMLGTPSSDYCYVTRGEPTADSCSVYGFDGDVLRYAITVNGGKEISPLRKLLAENAVVDRQALTDPDVPVKKTVKAALASETQ